jgi:hypothetical protein
VPEHFHESEQIAYVEVLVIPSNVPHRAVALEDTVDIDIFSPIRKDWLAKDDAYLRGGERE